MNEVPVFALVLSAFFTLLAFVQTARLVAGSSSAGAQTPRANDPTMNVTASLEC